MTSRAAAGLRAGVTNFLFKLLCSPLEKICRLLVIVAATRALGPTAFGTYQFAITVAAFLTLGTEFGLGTWTTRAVARDGAKAGPIVAAALRLRVASVVPYALLLAVVALAQSRGEPRAVMVVLGIAALANAFVDYFGSALRGQEDFPREAATNVARALLTTAGALVALRIRPTLMALAAGLTGGAIASTGVGLWILHAAQPQAFARFVAGPPRGQPTSRVTLGEIVPLWLTGVLSTLYFRCDILLLRLLAGETEVGLYGAAYRIFEAWTLLPGAVIAVGFPRLVRSRGKGSRWTGLEGRLSALLFASGVAAALLSLSADDRLVRWMFGGGFVRASASFRVLAFALPILFLNFGLSSFLLAHGRERSYLALSLGLLVMNVGINAVVIPRLGGVGAAWATLATEAARAVACLALLAAGPRERRRETPATADPVSAPR